MQITNQTIKFQPPKLTSNKMPTLHLDSNKISVKNNNFSMPALNAAYFHPSFCGNVQAIKRFRRMLDFINANPEKVTAYSTLKFERLFNNVIKPNFNKATYIDEGSVAIVHTIDNKYACRMLKPEYEHCDAAEPLNQEIIRSLKIWYGGEVANIGNTTFMKNADPEKIALSMGVPYTTPYREIQEYYKNNCIDAIAKMPQRAFDKVAAEFKTLNKFSTPGGEFYRFDTANPNNFLLFKNKIKIIDELCPVPFKDANNLASMSEAFVQKVYCKHDGQYDKDLVQARKHIFLKCLIANEKVGLPLNFNSREKLILCDALDFTDIRTSGEDRFERAESFVEKLSELRQNFLNLNERLHALRKYFNGLN